MPLFPAIANGSIVPSRFVVQDTTVDNKVLQATANQKVIGVAQKGTRNTPYGALDDGNAAIAGESLQIFGLGDTCTLEVGGAVTAGDYLESDSSGRGVTSSTDGHFVGAIAGQAASAAGQLIEVQLVQLMRGA